MVLETLERALRSDADHPGACHYCIHSVEAAYPEKAVGAGDRLATLMPGAGHLPESGRSLFGLAESLEAQGRRAEAERVRNRFRRAWKDADVTLTASRF